jgi:hypothetical protein
VPLCCRGHPVPPSHVPLLQRRQVWQRLGLRRVRRRRRVQAPLADAVAGQRALPRCRCSRAIAATVAAPPRHAVAAHARSRAAVAAVTTGTSTRVVECRGRHGGAVAVRGGAGQLCIQLRRRSQTLRGTEGRRRDRALRPPRRLAVVPAALLCLVRHRSYRVCQCHLCENVTALHTQTHRHTPLVTRSATTVTWRR